MPLTFATAHRASTIPWSAEALAFFAGMERVTLAFPTTKPAPSKEDCAVAVRFADELGPGCEIGSPVHAVRWLRALNNGFDLAASMRRDRARVVARGEKKALAA
jgi:hypothetical protein